MGKGEKGDTKNAIFVDTFVNGPLQKLIVERNVFEKNF